MGLWDTLAKKAPATRGARVAPHRGRGALLRHLPAPIPVRGFAPGTSKPTRAKTTPPHRLALSLTTSSEGTPGAPEEMGKSSPLQKDFQEQ